MLAAAVAIFIVHSLAEVRAPLGEFFTRTLTTLDGQRVIDAGPCRVVRHPGYLAQLLVLVPFAALLSERWPPPLAALLLLAGIYARRISLEERMLASRFGAAWSAYARRAWRMLPPLY